jgi:hypothetical protein
MPRFCLKQHVAKGQLTAWNGAGRQPLKRLAPPNVRPNPSLKREVNENKPIRTVFDPRRGGVANLESILFLINTQLQLGVWLPDGFQPF